MTIPPLNRILVATDGSADSRLATRAAIDLARRASATLDVVNAWEVTVWPYMYGQGLEGLLEAMEAESRELVEAVATAATAAGVHVGERRSVHTTAADAVVGIAQELGSDLIVVGSRGLGPVRRLVMGSVSEAIVHAAGRAVLVVRGGDDAWPPRNVVAADDGEGATWPAIWRAADVARLLRAPLELVEVLHPIGWLSHVVAEQALAAVRAHLDTRAGRIEAQLGTRPDTDVRIGDAVGELLDATGPAPHSLVVCGSHGRGMVQRFRLGSVSTNLVHAAEGPVLIVPTFRVPEPLHAAEAPALVERASSEAAQHQPALVR